MRMTIFGAPDIRERFANQGVALPLGSAAALGGYVEKKPSAGATSSARLTYSFRRRQLS